mmetsp:Transcript_23569/g.66083  ORF Transcript_23569/g.66083 Transcript_23569/m.66083 type:complete len:223 (+) Transcript_23569:353-1021(+)
MLQGAWRHFHQRRPSAPPCLSGPAQPSPSAVHPKPSSPHQTLPAYPSAHPQYGYDAELSFSQLWTRGSAPKRSTQGTRAQSACCPVAPLRTMPVYPSAHAHPAPVTLFECGKSHAAVDGIHTQQLNDEWIHRHSASLVMGSHTSQYPKKPLFIGLILHLPFVEGTGADASWALTVRLAPPSKSGSDQAFMSGHSVPGPNASKCLPSACAESPHMGDRRSDHQ